MKVVTIVGARPQFIKAAAVSRAFAKVPCAEEVLVHTGQHYDADMSDVFFEQLGIPRPSYHLGVGGTTHGAMTGRQLEKIEEVLLLERPNWVLVYGDTNSTLAGALAAAKLHIPVAHVEAGLRSYNRRMPEEVNRVLTDHLSDLLFAPTFHSVGNLRGEGIDERKIAVVGDVMYDAVLFYRDRDREPQWFGPMGLADGDYVLCTVHRAENTDDPVRLQSIFDGLGAAGFPVVMPVHPRTKAKIAEAGILVPDAVRLVPPVGYLEMAWLESRCTAIATDSGGVQKEAYFHGKRCITLRDETEWVELVEIGANQLAGTDPEAISKAISAGAGEAIGSTLLYGDGDASGRIVSELLGAGKAGT
jgi:UDP-GlcNAc3NAcA epimerase